MGPEDQKHVHVYMCQIFHVSSDEVSLCVCVLSCVLLFATQWAVAQQAPCSVGFSRQESWNGLPFPPPRDLPNPGMEPASLVSPALAGGFFTTSAT